jgi:tetratricopeptide (TPR) repeat protein
MHADARGLALTASSADAVRHYDATVAAYLRFDKTIGDHLKATLAADPEMPMALVLRGYFFRLFCKRDLESRATKSLEAAAASLAARGGSDGEKGHVAALKAWCAGDFVGAIACWEAILLDQPRDIVALKLAHFGHFYMGDAENMRDSVARALYAWDADTPGYGFVLGLRAFGLEESGDYESAERVGRHAIEINPQDIWAAHAVAHVMEMQGRPRDGVVWIDNLEDAWGHCNNFAYHVWWHRALFLLEQERFDAVLAHYDKKVRVDLTEEYLDICNAASLLWRLEQMGVDVGQRWSELAACAARFKDEHILPFIDAHYMMALAADRRGEEAQTMIESLRAHATLSPESEAQIFGRIGGPLCEALLAYRRGDYGRAVDLLLPLRYAWRRIGGSHAQRDVFTLTLIEAAIRAGRLAVARALLAERTALKPNDAWTWKSFARVLDGLKDTAGATAARSRAYGLLSA